MRSFSSARPPVKKTRASMLVHGLTGKGKTTRALRGGKPLVICTEPKAEAHVLMLNPAATCWVPESCNDLMDIFQWLGDAKLLEQGFTRIVLDSYTELTELLPNWILRKQAADANLELGRKISIDEYRPLQEWGVALIRAIQLSGLPSIIIARSDSKKVGLLEMVVPAGLGSSARNLNAQLVPTVESRWDSELQDYIWDSRPDEYSQRCGLLWVPAVFRGTADEFLAAVERGEGQPQGPEGGAPEVQVGQEAAPAPAPAPPVAPPPPAAPAAEQPPAPAPKQPAVNPPVSLVGWQNAIVELNQILYKAPGWTADERTKVVQGWEAQGMDALPRLKIYLESIREEAKTPGAAIAQMAPLPPANQVTPLAENFVDQMADGKDSLEFIASKDAEGLPAFLQTHGINQEAFLRYCAAEKHLVPDSKGQFRLDRIVKKAWEKLNPILQSERRRGSLAAFIKEKHSTAPSTAV